MYCSALFRVLPKKLYTIIENDDGSIYTMILQRFSVYSSFGCVT